MSEFFAAAFGVGRNVLREAVKVLAGKGFIRTAQRYGLASARSPNGTSSTRTFSPGIYRTAAGTSVSFRPH